MKCLFIGGHKDGKVMNIPEDESYIQTPNIKSAPITYDPKESAFIDVQEYRRMNLAGFRSIFIHADLTERQAILMLIGSYVREDWTESNY